MEDTDVSTNERYKETETRIIDMDDVKVSAFVQYLVRKDLAFGLASWCWFGL